MERKHGTCQDYQALVRCSAILMLLRMSSSRTAAGSPQNGHPSLSVIIEWGYTSITLSRCRFPDSASRAYSLPPTLLPWPEEYIESAATRTSALPTMQSTAASATCLSVPRAAAGQPSTSGSCHRLCRSPLPSSFRSLRGSHSSRLHSAHASVRQKRRNAQIVRSVLDVTEDSFEAEVLKVDNTPHSIASLCMQ